MKTTGSEVLLYRLFQIAAREWGKSSQWEGMGNFAGGLFLLGGGNLRSSDFDQLNLFQS